MCINFALKNTNKCLQTQFDVKLDRNIVMKYFVMIETDEDDRFAAESIGDFVKTSTFAQFIIIFMLEFINFDNNRM